MLKVSALTSGPLVPSANFRVRQYIPYLKEYGVDVTEHVPLWNKFDAPSESYRKILHFFNSDNPKNWNRLKLLDRYRAVITSKFYDITWIQKTLIPYHLTLELKTSKPMVFDLDDAIWLDEGKGFADKIVAGANHVIVGNSYLADWTSQYNANVSIVPTAIDLNLYQNKNKQVDRFVIGWIGTSSNFKYLKLIVPALKRFVEKRNDVKIKIIADRFPDELIQLISHIEFCQWHPDTYVNEMADFSVGIMPLLDDEWTKGKCSFKMLQYMAMKLPVIVSPYGMNEEVLTLGDIGYGPTSQDDWFDALESVYGSNSMCLKMGENGFQIIEDHFSIPIVARKIASVFNALA
jgi:glycosyltransferase involved in cell wall biosynthesis